MSLQCHPQALSPTRRHPGCIAFYPAIAADWGMPCHPRALLDYLDDDGGAGVWLDGVRVGALPDLPMALAWVRRWNKTGDPRRAETFT